MLFYGQETLLVVYEVLTFSVVDLLSANFVLAAILTYVMCQVTVVEWISWSVSRSVSMGGRMNGWVDGWKDEWMVMVCAYYFTTWLVTKKTHYSFSLIQIIVAIRYAAGRKNLSLKSTVDLRFLV